MDKNVQRIFSVQIQIEIEKNFERLHFEVEIAKL